MKYHLSGSDIAADVVYPTHVRATKTEPIELQLTDLGPTHADIARLGGPDGPDGPESKPATLGSPRPAPLILAGRYRLLRRLGRGGMGTVYLADQLDCRGARVERRVAIKILDASAHDWCRTIDRFLWEARLCARIQHPNVVQAFEYGSTPTGVVFMVMELLEGRDLRTMIREHGRLSWRWTRFVMRQVCAGMDALHRIGVVHRDLKSSNCFYMRRNGGIKVLDLGIATFEDPRLGPITANTDDRAIVGTPEYMAPEQIRGAAVDRRADVYSAGILIYELLTGQVPFRGHTTEAVFDQQLSYPPPPIDRIAPDVVVPPGLDEVLRKALAKRPSARYSSMPELAAALGELCSG